MIPGHSDLQVNNAAVGGVERVDDPALGPKPVGEQVPPPTHSTLLFPVSSGTDQKENPLMTHLSMNETVQWHALSAET